jgi:hypothetical protein
MTGRLDSDVEEIIKYHKLKEGCNCSMCRVKRSYEKVKQESSSSQQRET